MITTIKRKSKWTVPLMALLLVNTIPAQSMVKNNKKVSSVGTAKTIAPVTKSVSVSEAFRHKVPTLPGPRPFKLAAVTSYNLPNGLSVQLLPDHRVPFITVALGVTAGSTLDPKQLLGLSGMTADMLTEGTTTRTSKQIADEVDFIGGGLGASADYDHTIINGSALSKYAPRLLDIFADVVLNSNFPEDELKLKKTNLIQEISIKRSEPDFLLEERFNKVTFGKHPYAIVSPTEETVKALTKSGLKSFHDDNYLPNKSYLVIVGDFDLAQMQKLIEEKFGKDWQKSDVAELVLPDMPKQNGKTIYLVDRPGSVQSSIKLGNISIRKTDSDYFPFVVANQVLGGATNSRLFLNIREQKGYTYGAYSGIGARKEPGAFAAEAEVRTDVTAPSLEEFIYELDRIRKIKVSDKELEQAKSYLAGSFQLGLETQSGLTSRLLERKIYNLPKDYLESYVDKIMAVTPEQVRAVARKHMDLDNIIICVVGDANKIRPDLQYFGNVEVYDMAGKPVSVNGDIISTSASQQSLQDTGKGAALSN